MVRLMRPGPGPKRALRFSSMLSFARAREPAPPHAPNGRFPAASANARARPARSSSAIHLCASFQAAPLTPAFTRQDSGLSPGPYNRQTFPSAGSTWSSACAEAMVSWPLCSLLQQDVSNASPYPKCHHANRSSSASLIAISLPSLEPAIRCRPTAVPGKLGCERMSADQDVRKAALRRLTRRTRLTGQELRDNASRRNC